MKSCFIVNPNSGHGKGLKVWNIARAYMAKHGFDYEIYFAASVGDASYITKKLTEVIDEEGPAHIFVIGGDGTLNEVLNGINHMPLVNICYIPAASGGDFARSLKLQKNPRKILKNFHSVNNNQRIEAVDYGVLACENGEITRRFANSSGIGYDAAVCQRVHRIQQDGAGKALIKGRPAYVAEGIKELFFCKPTKGYIVLDGDKRVEFNHLIFVSVHIHPYEGGGFRFGNFADPKDGMLEICAVNCKRKTRLAMTLLKSSFKGLKNSRDVRTFQCREAHIHFDRPAIVHTDGECIRQQTDIDYRCVSQQFNIFR